MLRTTCRLLPTKLRTHNYISTLRTYVTSRVAIVPDFDGQPPPGEETDQSLFAAYKILPPVRPPNEPRTIKLARLTWASRKRGILETDLLLSTFSKIHLATLTDEQLVIYDRLLEENDWDIYAWATGSKTIPQRWQGCEVLGMLVEHSKNKGREILRMPDL